MGQEEVDRQRAEAKAAKENEAVSIVKKAMVKLRQCTVENFEDLKTELENAQMDQLLEMGEQAEKVSKESEKVIADAQKKVDLLKEKAEKAKEAARLRAEAEEAKKKKLEE